MYITYQDTIAAEDYNNLRKCVGWGTLSQKQAQTGIDHSAYLVAAYNGEKSVAMARLIHDGGYAAFIVDVVVHPDFQGKGIGRTMMEMILTYLDNTLEDGDICCISLMAAKGKEEFYRTFGFEERPTPHLGAGMIKWIRK